MYQYDNNNFVYKAFVLNNCMGLLIFNEESSFNTSTITECNGTT